MAFNEAEKQKYLKLMESYIERRRPAPEIRSKLDIAFRHENQSFVIYTIRPKYDDPNIKIESNIAKATYIRKQNIWKVFWQRADLKWHGYGPKPFVKRLEDFLKVVDEDKCCCFWG